MPSVGRGCATIFATKTLSSNGARKGSAQRRRAKRKRAGVERAAPASSPCSSDLID